MRYRFHTLPHCTAMAKFCGSATFVFTAVSATAHRNSFSVDVTKAESSLWMNANIKPSIVIERTSA